ncbi:phage holin family protein [Kocuria marina]|uniref:phage holin family protein n=1 Tax=Kocuria marina TaxID=223184 RepID=UPI0011A65271|nr:MULTISPECIES: phage holin family protein [Kocuria]MCT2022188.1 phage holin family protein [Kocuria marina]
MSHPIPPSEPEERAERESLGEMFKSLSTNLTTLIQQEIALAKAEANAAIQKATDSAKVTGKGAGLLGGAGVADHFVLLSLALMWALGNLVGLGWSAVIVAAVWAIIAAVGKKNLDRGKRKMAQATKDPLPRTRETVSEIPDTVKPSKQTR